MTETMVDALAAVLVLVVIGIFKCFVVNRQMKDAADLIVWDGINKPPKGPRPKRTK